MSRATKWILGIVSGLVGLCALAVAGFLMVSRFTMQRAFTIQRSFPRFEGPGGMPPFQRMPDQGLPFRHLGGFGPFGFLGGWLIVAGAIGLFALAAMALILILRRPSQAARFEQGAAIPGGPSSPVQPAAQDQPEAAEGEGAAEASAGGGKCPNCGREVQADWSHCPYCGTGLTGTGQAT